MSAAFTAPVREAWKGIGTYGTVGLEFALSVLVGLLGGWWLDRRLGTGGWLTFIGLGFGIAAGYRALYRALGRARREAERLEQQEKDARKRFHDDEHGE